MLAEAVDWIRVPVAVAFLLVFVVGVHEFAHFFFAKLFGIRVEEFALGFGPKLLARRRGETLYAIRAVPAGGFVRMAGMSGLEGDTDAGERNFMRASIPKRFITIAAGGLINLLLAGLMFGIAATESTPSRVTPQGPAATAGISDGDAILSIDGQRVDVSSSDGVLTIRAAVNAKQGRPVEVTYHDVSAVRTARITPALVVTDLQCNGADGALPGPPGQKRITAIDGRPVEQGTALDLLKGDRTVHVDGYPLGDPSRVFRDAPISGVTFDTGQGLAPGSVAAAWIIGFGSGQQGQSLPAGLYHGITGIPNFVRFTFRQVADVIGNPNTGGVTGCQGLSGPVGIVQATSVATREGIYGYLAVIGTVSLSLGILNLLPIPFLDGGRLLFLVIEAVRRRRVDPRHEAMVHAAGLAVLVVFALYITIFGDLSRVLQ